MTRSHYSPSLGRFLSRDPISEQGGLNLYAFVRNNPILLQDYLGKKIEGLPTKFIFEDVLSGLDLGITETGTPFGIEIKRSANCVRPSDFWGWLKRNCYSVTVSGKPPTIKVRIRKGLAAHKKKVVLEHEMMHFSIYSRNWSLAARELNQLEKLYCSWQWGGIYDGEIKADLAVKYGGESHSLLYESSAT